MKVAIVGTGLIGTSIGLALRARGARRIAGWDSRRPALRAAKAAGGITTLASSLDGAVGDAETVVLAVPLDVLLDLAPDVIARARRGAFIVDVAGLKTPVLRRIRAALRRRPDIRYVSAHPMAGKEQSGAIHGSADLFEGRQFALIIPVQRLRFEARKSGEAFARRLGARPSIWTASAHDRVIASTSALPQLAAIALALAVGATAGKARSLAGPGYRDATRLAASPYSVWRPLLRGNARAVARNVGRMERILQRIRLAVGRHDERALARMFAGASLLRRRVAAP